MRTFIINIVCCTIFEVLAGILLPEGRLRKFTLSVVGLYLFCSIAYPIISFLMGDGAGLLEL